MSVYSIKDLEKLTGIKAHTIRIWEKRYNIISPKRTESNIRYYMEDDLKQIINIAMLNRNGYKISKISSMTNVEISQKVAEISDFDIDSHTMMDSLTLSMLQLDEFKFDKILNRHIELNGFEHCVRNVLFPLLDKIALMWITGSIKQVHENFMINIMRQKIVSAIDAIEPFRNKELPKVIIFLPPKEDQELSLLLSHYFLKARQINVLNLGMEINVNDVRDAFNIYHCDYIFTTFNDSFSETKISAFAEGILEECADVTLLLSGFQVARQNIASTDQVVVLADMEKTIAYFDQIATLGS